MVICCVCTVHSLLSVTVLSQPLKWLFFTSHNSRYAANWFLFSSNVLLVYPPPKKKNASDAVLMYCTQTNAHHVYKLFTKWHFGSSCFKKTGKSSAPQHTSWYIWKYFQMVQGNSQKSKLSNVHDFNIRFSRCLCYIKTMGLSLCGALDWLKVIWLEHLWDSELFEMPYFLDWLAVKCHFVWVMSQKVKNNVFKLVTHKQASREALGFHNWSNFFFGTTNLKEALPVAAALTFTCSQWRAFRDLSLS